MSKDLEDDDLGKVSRDADELLKKLDAIKGESRQVEQPQPAKQNTRTVHERETNSSSTKNEDSRSHRREAEFSSALALIVVVILAAGAILSPQRRDGANPQNTSTNSELSSSGSTPLPKEMSPRAQDSTNLMPKKEVYFEGIKLPITNSLCNKKNTFCINGLARLVEYERGSASYNFEDSDNGQRVSIQGEIRIASVERNEDGSRTFSFSFRDNQGVTTPGWAAAGRFYLDQDAKQPGILTRFKTTESFGPKTPVGLENTSYLFPR